MKFFLYKMKSDDPAPPWGTVKDWFYYYKWGRPESVSFFKPEPFYPDLCAQDYVFFVLDGVVIAHAVVQEVDIGFMGVGNSRAQEFRILGDSIWEHKGKARMKLSKKLLARDQVAHVQGARWVRESIGEGELAISKT